MLAICHREGVRSSDLLGGGHWQVLSPSTPKIREVLMSEAHENLLRASRVARLDALLSQLQERESLQAIDEGERAWLTSLLHPLGTGKIEVRLLPASQNIAFESGLLVEALLKEYAVADPDLQKLQEEFAGIVRLLQLLTKEIADAGDEDTKRAMRVARLLRKHLLHDDAVPTRPEVKFG